jgi:hypothetical protein
MNGLIAPTSLCTRLQDPGRLDRPCHRKFNVALPLNSDHRWIDIDFPCDLAKACQLRREHVRAEVA